jgi:hypothetical protein
MSSFYDSWKQNQDQTRAQFNVNQAQTNLFRAQVNQAPVAQQMAAQRDLVNAQTQANAFLPNK